MAVTYKGKKPGKLWYFQKRCGAILKTFRSKDTKIDAAIFARDIFITVGVMAAAIALSQVSYLAVIPFAYGIIGSIAGVTSLTFGIKSWMGLKRLNKSTPVYYHMKDAEENWLKKKMRAPLLTRLQEGLSLRIAKIKAAIAAPFAIFKHKKKALTATAEVTSVAAERTEEAATAPAAVAADSFSAAAKPAAPTAEELEAEADRQARAEARANRKARSGSRFQ